MLPNKEISTMKEINIDGLKRKVRVVRKKFNSRKKKINKGDFNRYAEAHGILLRIYPSSSSSR